MPAPQMQQAEQQDMSEGHNHVTVKNQKEVTPL